MSYRRSKRPPRRILPIANHLLVAVKTDRLITLVFEDNAQVQASITLEQAVTISAPDGTSIHLTATKPGTTFDPNNLQPLLALCHTFVKEAFATNDGRLTIIFDDTTQLTVVPEIYEAWHFQRPAPFSPNKDTQERLLLTGSDGELI